MSDPDPALERRVVELEAQVQRLVRELAEERTNAARRARRERLLRLAFWIAVGLAYVVYLYRLTDLF